MNKLLELIISVAILYISTMCILSMLISIDFVDKVEEIKEINNTRIELLESYME